MNLKESLSILQPEVNTLDGLKAAYRAASMKYHPDHGGDIEMMKLVNLAYEFLKDNKWSAYDGRAAANGPNLTESIKAVWDKVKHYPATEGELIGTWIWLHGETWRYKKELKEHGFRWSNNKRAWYWHPEGYRKRSRRTFDINEIRSMFGSSDLDSETASALA